MLAAGGSPSVRRLVTLGSPHAGVQWKGPLVGVAGEQMRHGSAFLTALAKHPLTVPTLSIYSTHDNIVYPPETSSLAAQGGTDLLLHDYGHLALLFVPEVMDRVAQFLEAEEPAVKAAPRT